jgi:hypothetical protein
MIDELYTLRHLYDKPESEWPEDYEQVVAAVSLSRAKLHAKARSVRIKEEKAEAAKAVKKAAE